MTDEVTTVKETATEVMEEKEVITGDEPANKEVTEESAGGEGEGDATETKETAQAKVEDKEHPKKKSRDARIDELTWKFRDKEREAEYWKNLAIQGQVKPPASEIKSPVEQEIFTKPRPKLDNYNSVEEYDDAVYEWRMEKDYTHKKVDEIKTAVKGKIDNFMSKTATFKEKHPDYDEVINAAKVFTPQMSQAILHADNGVEIAYHLSQPGNKALADKIAKMSNERQFIEIGKLDAKFTFATETKKASATPPPIKPIYSIGVSEEKDREKMTDEEWLAWRKKQNW